MIIAMDLGAFCTEAQQCGLFGISCSSDGWTRDGLHQPANTTIVNSLNQLHFVRQALQAPPQGVCCYLDKAFFLSLYSHYGRAGLSVYTAVLTFCISQLCFQSAACGCVQRCSDKTRYYIEHAGHILLLVLAVLAVGAVFSYLRYIADNALWSTLIINFLLTKIGSLVGALMAVSMVFNGMWMLQTQTQREGRFGNDSYYIQWDDIDAQESCMISFRG